MKFTININKDFEIKLSSHMIKVRFVPPDHESICHQKDKEEKRRDQMVDLALQLLEKSDKKELADQLNFVIEQNSTGHSCHTKEEKDITADFGCWDTEKMTIFIRKDVSPEMKLSTLFHEMIHAIECVYTTEFDHKDLNLVGEVFSQIFLDNFKKR